jgi:hypothetical protein
MNALTILRDVQKGQERTLWYKRGVFLPRNGPFPVF